MRRMARTPTKIVEPAPAQPATKTAIVLDLMRRPDGATLDDVTNATSWQPHSTRAALTGLRKKGYPIARCKRGDVTCYTLGTSA